MNDVVRRFYNKLKDFNDIIINDILKSETSTKFVSDFNQFSEMIHGVLRTSIVSTEVNEETSESDADTHFLLSALRIVALNIDAYEQYHLDNTRTSLVIYRNVLVKEGFVANDQLESITIQEALENPKLAISFISPIAFSEDSLYRYDSVVTKKDVIRERISNVTPFITMHERIYQELILFNDKISFVISYEGKSVNSDEDTIYEDFYQFFNGIFPILDKTYRFSAISDQSNPHVYAEGELVLKAARIVKQNVDQYKKFIERRVKASTAEMKKLILFSDGFYAHTDLSVAVKYSSIMAKDSFKEAYATGRRFINPIGYIDDYANFGDIHSVNLSKFEDLELNQLAKVYERTQKKI
ncbi:hypothetical protein HCA73_16315 [Listeria booriae]|uniref:hypothetical protein n=1 Tax=Listeria booriae TaxID=1552123 RepID=UPI00162926ED|nr:hypothetical protein [Listeria booriae]MBC1914218.1 hypothetical protein [Listeria booriae]